MSTAKALSRKRIVLLDDSVEFRDDFLSSQERLPPEAQATYEFEAPDCYDPQTLESLVDAPPDFLVIDWTVGSENGAIDWLKELTKQKTIDCIKRVLLIGGIPLMPFTELGFSTVTQASRASTCPKAFTLTHSSAY